MKRDKLKRARLKKGLSQDVAAGLVGVSRTTWSLWETGTSHPYPLNVKELCAFFGVSDPADLDLEPAEDHVSVPQPAPASHVTHLSPIAFQTPDTGQSIYMSLDQAESILSLSWDTWFASRPRQARREITKLLPQLEKMIYTSLAALDVLRVKELFIRAHGLLGAICLDALQNDTALYHYMQAHRYAEELHDTNLTTTYLALMGDVLRRQHDKTRAISTGNETAFERTISEATDLLSSTGEGRDTAKKEFIPFEIYEIRGKANRDLGKPLQAIPYLELAEKSLNSAESVTPRWHALLEISRGQAFCDAGDLVIGIELASKGFRMAQQCHSPRQMNRVRKLLRKLETGPAKNERKIHELRELVHDTYLRMDLEK